MLYASLHVDPAAGWFPHLFGHADEVGPDHARGATLNRPLPEGTGDDDWVPVVADLAAAVTGFGATALVVSLGVDAAADDPESPLEVTGDGYANAGRLLGELGLPSVIVQEGGYHLPSLGALVEAVPRRARGNLPGPARRRDSPMTHDITVLPVPAMGAEDVVVDAAGHVWTGTEDGAIWRLTPDGKLVDRIAQTGGRPLGIEIDGGGDLLVCDAKAGLLRVSMAPVPSR